MPLPAMIAPRNAVAALRWPTVSAAAPNAATVATPIVPTSSTSSVALRKYSASTSATSSAVTTLDSNDAR